MTVRDSVSLVRDALNTVHQNFKIRRELRRSAIGLVVFDVVGLGDIERTVGEHTGDQILALLRNLIHGLQREIRVQIIGIKNIGDDFSLFVKFPVATGDLSEERFLQLEALEIRSLLEKRIALHLPQDVKVQLYVGSAIIRSSTEKGYEASIYKAMKQANHDAKHVDFAEQIRAQEFHDILENKLLESHFQPIVSLETGELWGVEALLRGPTNSSFASPDNLFGFAHKTDKLSHLDILTMETAITRFSRAGLSSKLFLNVESKTLMESPDVFNNIMAILNQFSLLPHDVVLEITERAWVGNFALFNRKLDSYRNIGFSVAVDDVGIGYSSLQAITELRPEYIKVDKSLVSHIDREMVKSVMLETLVDFAHKVNCSVIAEGIETEDELAKVIDLGIHYGQGYLIGKPAPRLLQTRGALINIPEYASSDKYTTMDKFTVGKLVRDVPTFGEETRVSEVAHYFHQHEGEHSAVILNGFSPIGLVMRDKLLSQLATQYGVPLYWHRSIRKVMDASPLIFETSMNVEVASQLSMEREPSKVYDSIVVTESGNLKGIITIQDIVSAINTVQLERARGSNPLTGLPGNRSIKREIRRRIASGTGFSIIYADIDHFKWFNDKYGFYQGDQVIDFLSDVLVNACSSDGVHSEDFIGHIGGDDFIILTDNERPESLCEEIIGSFDNNVVRFYASTTTPHQEEIAPLQVTDRDGKEVQANGLTLSLSLLRCPAQLTSLTLEEIVQEVTVLKKTAKSHVGSKCIQRDIQVNHVSSPVTAPQPPIIVK